MGWGSFGQSQPGAKDPRSSGDDQNFQVSREQREKCWEARDVFFSCLDKNDIVDPLKEAGQAKKVCGDEAHAFDRSCASSWVEYFKKQRVMQIKKGKMLDDLRAEGAVGIDMSTAPGKDAPGKGAPTNKR